jgi:glycerol-3-phosphate dehydrogenase
VKWAFAGVRSLYDDGSNKPEDVTRDYYLSLDERFREAPVLTIYGGKITTYRRLAEAALERLKHFFYRMRPPWTGRVPLPGGDFAWDAFEAEVEKVQQNWPFLEADQAGRLVQAYGTRLARILGAAKSWNDLGMRFGADLTEVEVRYLMQHEFAETADDILWRRTKLGLHASDEEKEALGRFMATAAGSVASA